VASWRLHQLPNFTIGLVRRIPAETNWMSAASAPLLAEHTKVMPRYRVFCDAYGLSAADQYRLLDLVVERTRRMRNVLIDNANREPYASLVRDGHRETGRHAAQRSARALRLLCWVHSVGAIGARIRTWTLTLLSARCPYRGRTGVAPARHGFRGGRRTRRAGSFHCASTVATWSSSRSCSCRFASHPWRRRPPTF